jgi:hypothetical protein
VYRLHAERKRGNGTFPLSIGSKGGKLRFNAEDIERYIASQSNNAPPVNVTATKQRKKQEREYEERQRKADKSLERHRQNRKTKVQES